MFSIALCTNITLSCVRINDHDADDVVVDDEDNDHEDDDDELDFVVVC